MTNDCFLKREKYYFPWQFDEEEFYFVLVHFVGDIVADLEEKIFKHSFVIALDVAQCY